MTRLAIAVLVSLVLGVARADVKSTVARRKASALPEAAWPDCGAGRGATAQLTVEAAPEQPLFFAFSGSAFLLPYYFGVVSALQQRGRLDPATTRFGGISGGAITSMLTCAGMDPPALFAAFTQLKDHLVANPQDTARRFSAIAKQTIYDAALTEEAYQRCGQGHVRVAMTALDESADSFDAKSVLVVENFTSAGDIEEALLGSSYLSCFAGPSTYVTFRGKPVIDGGYSADFKDLCPEDGSRCVKIASYFVGEKTGNEAAVMYCGNEHAPEPYNPLPNWPRFQDPAWKLPTSCEYKYTNFTNATSPDIHPGKYSSIKYSKEAWQHMAMCLPGSDEWDYIFETGIRDGEGWDDAESQLATLALVAQQHYQRAGGNGRPDLAPLQDAGVASQRLRASVSASFSGEESLRIFIEALSREPNVASVTLAGLRCPAAEAAP